MGVGTKVDMGKAKQWAAKAAAQGNQRAADLLKTLASDKGSKQWSKTMEEMKKGVPKGATGAEAAGALIGCHWRHPRYIQITVSMVQLSYSAQHLDSLTPLIV
jgi:TPR repeat protein